MTTDGPTPNHDALMDQLWDYLQGELAPEQVESFEAALRKSPETIQAGVDLIEVIVMTREACRREGEARKELFLGASQEHKFDDVISAVTDPETHAAKGMLAELARLEAQAKPAVVDLTATSRQRRVFEDTPKQDAVSLRQLLDVSGYVLRHSLKTKAAAMTGLAAVLMLSLLLFAPWGDEASDPLATDTGAISPENENPATARNTVATLTASRDAQWQGASGTALPDVGDELLAGQRLTLVAGVAEITTNDGAIAILQAPATVELLDNDNALRLHTGKLVGICETESAKGFLVRTPHMDVTDLGTRFGVVASPDQATEVHVFEGEVEAMLHKSTGNTPRIKQRITENQAVRSDGSLGTLTSIEPAFNQFASALVNPRRFIGFDVLDGVARLSGQVDWVESSRFLGIEKASLPTGSRAALFGETFGHTLKEELPIDAEAVAPYKATTALRPGTSIRSYILMLNPGGTKTTTEGEIVFDREILGIITARTWPVAVDVLRAGGLANPFASSFNGVFGIEHDIDSVEILSDRRTLRFKMTATGAGDAIRVILREPTVE